MKGEFGMKSKVTTRGQVSIPSQIRKRFNIEPESRVDWIVEANVIKVVPLPKDPVKKTAVCKQCGYAIMTVTPKGKRRWTFCVNQSCPSKTKKTQ